MFVYSWCLSTELTAKSKYTVAILQIGFSAAEIIGCSAFKAAEKHASMLHTN